MDSADTSPGDGKCAAVVEEHGRCTLRAAIEEANATPASDRITFGIETGGGDGAAAPVSFAIRPGSPLPKIEDQGLTVDGYSQPGATPNTNETGDVSNARLLVELDGSLLQDSAADGLVIDAADVVIQGLVINGFPGDGLQVNANGVVIAGNFIGTDVSGTVPLGNGGNGVSILRGTRNQIGGAEAAAGNLISGNLKSGVFIGTDRTGVDNHVLGNRIGTDLAGQAALGNSEDGVTLGVAAMLNRVGGTTPGEANLIGYNGGAGVFVTGRSAVDNAIRGNVFVANAGLAIDLSLDGAYGITPNDQGDQDSGGNNLQNFPVLTGAVLGPGTRLTGFLNSLPRARFIIDFYRTADDASLRYLGSETINTDDSGNATWDVTIPVASRGGDVFFATATQKVLQVDLSTSEFSKGISTTTPAAIRGYRFHDSNGNGIDDGPGEPRVSDVGVRLVQLAGYPVAHPAVSATTDSSGRFTFENLVPGDYEVTYETPAGVVPTASQPLRFSVAGGEVYVAEIGQADDLIFDQVAVVEPGLALGEFTLVQVRGRKFNDRNANGILDPGEPGLKGWQIELTMPTPNGDLVLTQTTDSYGGYLFTDLGPGTVTVRSEVRSEWQETLPDAPGAYQITTQSEQNIAHLDFGGYLSFFAGVVVRSASGNGPQANKFVVVSELPDAQLVFFGETPGTSNGRLSRLSSLSLPANSRPQSVFVGDLDGNGWDDLAVASVGVPTAPSTDANGILLYYANAEGTSYAYAGRVPLCSTFLQAGEALRCDGPVDIDGGRLAWDDTSQGSFLVTANERSDTISVIQQDLAGGFAGSNRVEHISVGRSPIAVRVGRINDDSFADFAVANFASGDVSIFTGDGSGNFSLHTTVSGLNAPSNLLLEDLNGDGATDMVVANNGSHEVVVYLNQGDGAFGSGLRFPVGQGPRSVAAGDLNGDGIIDLAVANADAQTVTVLLGNSSPAGPLFQQTIVFGLPPIPGVNAATGQSPQVVLIEDIDGLGQLDLVVAHLFGGVSVHLNGVDDGSRDAGTAVGEQPRGADPATLPGAPGHDSQPLLQVSHRDSNPLDVNGDDFVSALDALLVINALNARLEPRAGEPLVPAASYALDTTGDQHLTPLDALLIINDLNHAAASSLSANDFAVRGPSALDIALSQIDSFETDPANREKRPVDSSTAAGTASPTSKLVGGSKFALRPLW